MCSTSVSLSIQVAASASPFAAMESQTVMISLMKRAVKTSPGEMTSVPPYSRSLVLNVALRGKYCRVITNVIDIHFTSTFYHTDAGFKSNANELPGTLHSYL